MPEGSVDGEAVVTEEALHRTRNRGLIREVNGAFSVNLASAPLPV